jgi:hypothetical protein
MMLTTVMFASFRAFWTSESLASETFRMKLVFVAMFIPPVIDKQLYVNNGVNYHKPDGQVNGKSYWLLDDACAEHEKPVRITDDAKKIQTVKNNRTILPFF